MRVPVRACVHPCVCTCILARLHLPKKRACIAFWPNEGSVVGMWTLVCNKALQRLPQCQTSETGRLANITGVYYIVGKEEVKCLIRYLYQTCLHYKYNVNCRQ